MNLGPSIAGKADKNFRSGNHRWTRYVSQRDHCDQVITRAIRAVSLQLDDATMADILDPFVHAQDRKVHGPGIPHAAILVPNTRY